MKRKDLFWMLVPCLLVIGVGAYFSRRPQHAEVEYGVVLDEVKLVSPTPREIALGYDKVVMVKAHITPPDGVKFDKKFPQPQLNFETKLLDAKGSVISKSSVPDFRTVTATPDLDAQQGTIRLKLAAVPAKAGTLFFEVNASGRVFGKNSRVLNPPVSPKERLLVRRQGEIIRTSTPNKSRPFKSVKIVTFPNGNAPGFPINIHVQLLEKLKTFAGRPSFSLDNRRIIADGKFIALLNFNGASGGGDPFVIDNFVPIPANCRNATFKADLSINDCWPLPISVVLRKDGKNTTRSEPAP